MRPLALLRALTPLGWLTVLAAGAALLIAFGHGLGLRWDPFDLGRRRTEAAQTRAETVTADAAARRLEVQGAADQAVRLDRHITTIHAVERITAVAADHARSAHDAETLLDPARADRLRDHDHRLCELAPDACLAAALDPAAGGDGALPDRRLAESPDPE